jgi:hypothetical protein
MDQERPAGFRPGMQSLLDLLRGRLEHALSDTEFSNLLQIAGQENVLPYAAARLRPFDVAFTPAQRGQLEDIHRKLQLSTFAWTETLRSTLFAFHRADLPVIALKGPSLAERIYGDASLRTCYDLDLLVRRSDVPRAERLLAGLGFSPNGHADDYHRAWSRKSANLELHHNVENPHALAFDMDAAWARATPSDFHGAPLCLMAPADELLYLCLHAVRHRFERICLHLDLSLAFRRIASPSASMPQRTYSVFNNILVLGWMMAAHLDSAVPPLNQIRVSEQNRNRLQKLADHLWQELMLAPPPPLDWAAQHRFYLEVENPGWDRFRRRLRHQRILATRLIDDDFIFAGRFHLRRKWQARLLRPLRLLIKTLRPAPKMP